jgi:flagellar FliJ protein
MMFEALSLLIDAASAERDRQAALLASAREAQGRSEATLQRLHEFRGECLARSAAGRRGQGDAASLQTYQLFVGRLDEAIRLQHADLASRVRKGEEQLQQLQQVQQRLLALQALAARNAQELRVREQRREQRDCDEFAARSFLRMVQEDPV